MNYINLLLAKINHFNSKMADPNDSDIHSLYHSNYSTTSYISYSFQPYCFSVVMGIQLWSPKSVSVYHTLYVRICNVSELISMRRP